MSRFGAILFDLDGTVADTFPGIVQAAEALVAALGRTPPPRSDIEALTGKGISALVEGVLARTGGSPPGPAADVERRYRELYASTCVSGTRLYPGMRELLAELPPPLALLTNKARPFTDQILAGVGLAARFDVVVAGDDPGMKYKPDPWCVDEALRRLGAKSEGAVLVGDTASDARAAAAAGVRCCIVGWGHGGPRAAQEATYRAGTVEELRAVLLGGPPPGRP